MVGCTTWVAAGGSTFHHQFSLYFSSTSVAITESAIMSLLAFLGCYGTICMEEKANQQRIRVSGHCCCISSNNYILKFTFTEEQMFAFILRHCDCSCGGHITSGNLGSIHRLNIYFPIVTHQCFVILTFSRRNRNNSERTLVRSYEAIQ